VGENMVRKGRFNISILVAEAKVDATKTKLITALTNLKNTGDIESAQWTLTPEDIPESGTV